MSCDFEDEYDLGPYYGFSDKEIECWKWIAKDESKCDISTVSRWKDDWDKFQVRLQKCDTLCPTKCRGCGNISPAQDVCSTVPVCVQCDTYVQPHLCNPINRKFVRTFLPTWDSFLLAVEANKTKK